MKRKLEVPHKEEFEKDEYRLGREIEKNIWSEILIFFERKVKRLADELEDRYEKIDEDRKHEWREQKEAEEKGEMHIGPEKSIETRKEEIERQVGDALYGITPDEKTIILEDIEEINEFHEGKDYRDKRREELLDKHSYEENEEKA